MELSLAAGRGQRVWPQVDLYVSQNVLTAADTWVLAEPDADGADLLFSNGYLCDQGCCPANASACALRQRSQPGTFAALPSDGPATGLNFDDQIYGSIGAPNFESDHIHIGTG